LGQGTTSASGLGAILAPLRGRIIEAELVRSDWEGKLASSFEASSLGKKEDVAEAAYRDAEARVNAKGATASAAAVSEANARLAAAAAALEDGKVRLTAGRHGQALLFFQSAERLAQEAGLTVDISSSVEGRGSGIFGSAALPRAFLGAGSTTASAKALGI
ncbi:hypothetical protein KW797_04765, partial [Candidatus Parcubacteria bacterium]|nr:hypothetical protein [Candidatus Parcubacteria bacterium]